MSQELQVVEESEEELICVIGDQEYMVDLETMLVFAVVPGSDEDPAEAGTWDSDTRQILFNDIYASSSSTLDADGAPQHTEIPQPQPEPEPEPQPQPRPQVTAALQAAIELRAGRVHLGGRV